MAAEFGSCYTSGIQSQPQKMSQINEQVDRLDKSLQELDCLLDSLHTKLESVLLPPAPTAGGSGVKVEDLICPLASTLREFNKKLSSHVERVRFLRDSAQN